MLAVLPPDSGADGDVSYDASNALVEGRDLESTVWQSWFCDAPAHDDDDVPPGSARRGFPFDVYDPDGDVWGSRLWLLDRAKVTDESIARARQYGEEALAWMLRDGVAKTVVVTSERLYVTAETQGIAIEAIITRPDGSRWSGAWDALTGDRL